MIIRLLPTYIYLFMVKLFILNNFTRWIPIESLDTNAPKMQKYLNFQSGKFSNNVSDSRIPKLGRQVIKTVQ